ncbi:serine hydrolase domain-containing protein [Actinomadura fibrosa]|uniref:Serine hydrolase domain-containing protein n=1 Tax=Actinomadura fibrosa TaxID=111802 RepID=A0ABW2XE35_9ACTN|nr:serine hydrolase domain-containing protein [Actinomadura fibrosa]
MAETDGARGFVAPGFEEIRDAFAADRPGVNAALAVHVGGERVIDLWKGPDHREDSIMGLYSATKGAAGIVLAVLVERGLLDLDAPVARYWPEFAAAGKQDITVRMLASHQAGLVNVDGGYTVGELIAHAPLAELLAAQAPLWTPGEGHGYHAVTIGTLLDELVRRVTGTPLGAFFRREIAEPRGIDVHIGLPEPDERRLLPVRPVAPGRMPGGQGLPPFFVRAMEPGRSGGPPVAAEGEPADDLLGMRAFRAAGVPSIGGFGSARGLAAMYAAVLPGADAPLVGAATLKAVTEVQAAGDDLVLPFPTSFATVFQRPARFAGPASFGHDGAAGAQAYADPDLGVAFGYVTDTPSGMGASSITGELTALLAQALG